MPQIRTPTDPNHRATTVKDKDIIKTSVACSENRKNKLKAPKMVQETETLAPTNLFPTTTAMIIKTIITIIIKTVTEPKES